MVHRGPPTVLARTRPSASLAFASKATDSTSLTTSQTIGFKLTHYREPRANRLAYHRHSEERGIYATISESAQRVAALRLASSYCTRLFIARNAPVRVTEPNPATASSARPISLMSQPLIESDRMPRSR